MARRRPPAAELLALLVALVCTGCTLAGDGPAPLFDPPRRPVVPVVKDPVWARNPVDAFVLAGLERKQLAPTKRADKARLLRRVTFDLIGLPPTAQEMDDFLKDESSDAYARVVDRLLASPRFGERMAQDWLDLVRYAESDGFKEDAHRPEAYRYRDWVIRSFNADLPYDRFVRLQVAGDELEPGSADALIATGFLRLHPDETNPALLEQRRQEILDDVTDTTGLVFLGLTVGCARCHDHKFDPTSQVDYYRLQSFLAGIRTSDLPALDAPALADYRTRLAAWEDATSDLRREMDALVAAKRVEVRKTTLSRFHAEIQAAANMPPEQRTPFQEQIALLAEKQVDRALVGISAKLPAEQKKRYLELEKQLAAIQPARPEAPLAAAVTDVGPIVPPTHRLLGGDHRKPRNEVRPGFPGFLGGGSVDTSLPPEVVSSGRRAALARWLTRPDHPLTARVMVNRLWQHHFGTGIVATPSDFGAQGTPPTHPELLDWLAVDFVEHGWSLKRLHRMLVTSEAYCQDSTIDPTNPAHVRAQSADPENTLLWHARRHRLEGEVLRDAMLSLSGELHPRMFGPSARPVLPPGISNYAWKPDERVEDQNRRSIYVYARRNLRYPLFAAFDQPDLHNSCGRRENTITAPQSLLLLNGDFPPVRARKLADDLLARHHEDEALVRAAYRLTWSRLPTEDEVRLGVRFLSAQTERYRRQRDAAGKPSDPRARAAADFCHALFNTNEFLVVD
jgi:hypothetical protein